MKTDSLMPLAHRAVQLALRKGAKEAAADAIREREVALEWRDGKAEQVSEAISRTLSLQLYVNGRYSSVSTSDLRDEALARFVEDAVAMTKLIAPDPYRALPDPVLYAGQSNAELQAFDPRAGGQGPGERQRIAKELEDAARSVKGGERILSVASSAGESNALSARVASNGFEGEREWSSFFQGADVSVKGDGDERPQDWAYATTRFLADLPAPGTLGREAARRALSRLGAKKTESAVLPVLVEARAAGRLFGMMLGPLSGNAIQQKRSFLEGRKGQFVASRALTVTDEPLLRKGLVSRYFDGEGIAAKAMPVIEKGALRNFFIDTYYGKKMGVVPTTGSASNLVFEPGVTDFGGLVASMKDGIVVTAFIGGNSNGTTGDFSVGVVGYRVRRGERAEAIGEMNLAGNHLTFWKELATVGNDPYPYSSLRTPSLLFASAQVAGT